MVEDLSRFHAPVGKLLEHSPLLGDHRRYGLSPDQLDFYRQNGYVSGVRVFFDVQVEMLCQELRALADPAHSGHESVLRIPHQRVGPSKSDVLFHALGAWQIEPGFHDLLWHPALAGARREATRRRGAILARPAVLQAGPAWGRGGLASGLFLLDAHECRWST